MKLFKRLLIVFVLIVAITAMTIGGLFLFRDTVLRIVIVQFLEYVLLTDVELEKTHLDFGDRDILMEGLQVHNPDGFETSTALTIGSVFVDMEPKLADEEKTHINKIELRDLLVTVEEAGGQKNLMVLSENVARLNEEKEEGADGSESGGSMRERRATSDVIIDHINVSGIEVQVAAPFLDIPIRFSLPDFDLEGLGGDEGASVSDAIEETLGRLSKDGMKNQLFKMPLRKK